MEFFLLWVGFSIVCAIIAKSKGRSPVAWFFLSCLISPLFTLILVIVLNPAEAEVIVEEVKFSGDRDLNNDAYKIFLSKKYDIQKNDVFGKFVCQEQMFPTIEEALDYVHEIESQAVAIKKSKCLDDGQIECVKCRGKNPAGSAKCRYCRYPLEI
jgi:hypothetical protein